MCGLAGILDPGGGRGAEELAALASAMAATLAHRGPDGHGVWVEAETGMALGHQRLAVIDLSPTGAQPMVSASGRHVLAYNGEIYNHKALRAELESTGYRFLGHSDTEVLLAAIDTWGLERALCRANGMFALAAWDRRDRRLRLARDRLGEKPLYYARVGRALVFGSELKALRAYPGYHPEVDRGALALYLRHSCVPAPHSIYLGTSKLPPATILTIDPAHLDGEPARPVPYWSAAEAARAGLDSPVQGALADLADRVEEVLGAAVAARMEADVPLGAFLSGGIDSSTVVALMQARSPAPVRTFTVGFDDPAYDESGPAAEVARHLGTDHVALRVTDREVMDVIPRLPVLYDEPFADSSQVPTFLVSQVARGHVTVCLSGDGGDELFGGYNRYTWGGGIWPMVARAPRPLRRVGAAGLSAVSPAAWDAVFDRLGPVLPRRARLRNPGHKMHKLASILPAEGPDELYRALTSLWWGSDALVLGAAESSSALTDGRADGLSHSLDRMMYLDLVSYLPDDILTKVDRASMAVSLEARVPMLDHQVVELAWRLPREAKVAGGVGKRVLRQVLGRHVPDVLVDRPKMGFGLPIGAWLRGSLRPWAEDLLDPHALAAQGYLDPEPVRSAWAQHLSGRANRDHDLWAVLMFQAWLQASTALPGAGP